ncbi:hypothetical protein L873DRAFT_1845044 [Choiromyces venosus 120613-1]|uniref:Uncharacterized protein n=1 Tax=Choiromyces venosus 120613-1 TaxID=1336337 RepID=A0A3N4JKE0_9PEZI|nr:hypothetical protein L873DRAFT_1845044 [Choiromyces venosus 120613-1]
MTQSAMRRAGYTVSRLPRAHTPGAPPTRDQTGAPERVCSATADHGIGEDVTVPSEQETPLSIPPGEPHVPRAHTPGALPTRDQTGPPERVCSATTDHGIGEDVTVPSEQEAPLSMPAGEPHVPRTDSAPTTNKVTSDGESGRQSPEDADDILRGPNDDVRDKNDGDEHQEYGQLVLRRLSNAVTSTTHGKAPWPTGAPRTRRSILPEPPVARGQRDSNTRELGSEEEQDTGEEEEDTSEEDGEEVDEPAAPRRLSNITITARSRLARRTAAVPHPRRRRVSQSTSPPSRRGGGNRQLHTRRRSDSLDGFIIADDDPTMTPQLMSDTEVSSELLPPGGINVETFNVFTNRLHVQSGYEPGVTNLGGRIVPEVSSPNVSSPVPTPPAARDTSPSPSALRRPIRDLHKRPPEAAAIAPRPTKRPAMASSALYRTRTSQSFADAIPAPSSSVAGPVILCEVVNYQAVREKAFRGVAGETVESLFKFYTRPATMAKSLVLLQNISGPGNNTLELGPVAVGQAEVASNDPQSSHLARMIRAGVQANKVCERSEGDMAQLAIREIMATITLYLIFTFVITPMWDRERPPARPDGSKPTKAEFFYETMGGLEALQTTARTFKDRASYGQTMWRIAESLGAPALLMIAAGGRGVAAAAREQGARGGVTQALSCALSTSALWWSFSHAVGRMTVDRLFAGKLGHCTAAQMAHRVRTEPLPVRILQIWDSVCRKEGITPEGSLPLDARPLVRGVNYPSVEVTWFGHVLSASPMIKDVNVSPHNLIMDLTAWLRGLKDKDDVVLDSKGKFKLIVLRDLLPDADITPALIDFYTALYNARALDGRKVLDTTQAQLFLQQPIDHIGLDKLREAVGEAAWANEIRRVLFSVRIGGTILGVKIFVPQREVRIYNWRSGDSGKALEIRVLKHRRVLTTFKLMRSCLPVDGWTISLAPLNPMAMVGTARESALSYLHYSRAFSSETVCPIYGPDPSRPCGVREIITGLVVDAFRLSREEGWAVHPRYWYGLGGRNVPG